MYQQKKAGCFPGRLVVECIPKEESTFRFRVYKAFYYVPSEDSFFNEITVPIGFKTDFASVPWAFRQFIPKSGRYNEAAVVHDYLCYLWKKNKYGIIYRKHADALFYEMMDVLGVGGVKKKVMFMGVGLYTHLVGYRLMPIKKRYKYSGKTGYKNRIKSKGE